MANIKSSQKSIKQEAKRGAKNSSEKSAVRTEAKKVMKAIEKKDAVDKSAVEAVFKGFVKKIDQASSKGAIHWKTAARKKSRLAKKLNAVISQ